MRYGHDIVAEQAEVGKSSRRRNEATYARFVLLTHFVQCREFRMSIGRKAGVAVFAGASLPSEADTI